MATKRLIEHISLPLTYGREVALCRLALGLSQTLLAQRAGMARSTLGAIERHDMMLKDAKVDRLARAFTALVTERAQALSAQGYTYHFLEHSDFIAIGRLFAPDIQNIFARNENYSLWPQ